MTHLLVQTSVLAFMKHMWSLYRCDYMNVTHSNLSYDMQVWEAAAAEFSIIDLSKYCSKISEPSLKLRVTGNIYY